MSLRLSLRKKLLLISLALGLLPVFLMGFMTTYQGTKALRQGELEYLQSVRDLKKLHIENFFLERKQDSDSLMDVVQLLQNEASARLQSIVDNKKNYAELFFKERLDDAKVFSRSESLSQAMEQFTGAFKVEGNQANGVAWKAVVDRYAVEIDQYRKERDFADVLLLDNDGNVVYSAAQRSEMGGNVYRDPLDQTPLKMAFIAGLKGVHIEDFAPYLPISGNLSAFITAPVHRFGEVVGVLALRLSMAPIHDIVQTSSGMGRSGRVSFLTPGGPLPRLDSGSRDHFSGVANVVRDGEKNAEMPSRQYVVEDRTGTVRLTSVVPLAIPGLDWRLEAGANLDEIINPVGTEAGGNFITHYIHRLGYENLYMIQPGGRIFFAAQPNDILGVNLLDDPKYRESHLATLVQSVVTHRMEGMSDMIPFAATGGTPASFFARPLLVQDKLAFVLVLQMSDTFINKLMKQRSGQGDGGETYLVGPDFLMRSDSTLDPEHYSVRTSFADPSRRAITTRAVKAALEQQSGVMESVNYRHDPVFVAFSPVRVGKITWALVAERDRDSVLRPVQNLKLFFVVLSLVITIMVVLVSWWTSRRITKTLTMVSQETVASAGEIATTILQQERISQTQAEAMTAITAGMGRLFDTARRSVEQADAATAGSDNVLALARVGEERLWTLQGNMDANSRGSEEIAQQIRSLSEKFVQIDEISAMVTDFAVETKILAMNAAVEAVRAGESGKGFTILAEEIRKLAEDSKRSTDRINNLVLELRQVTSGTVKGSHEGTVTAQEGLAIVRETSATFSHVTESAENASANAKQITLNLRNEEEEIKRQLETMTKMKVAARENAAGIAMINKGVQNLNQVVKVLDGLVHGK
ncbi:MAG: methyl-accepting chemotaxis protein [Magnetococcus sp. THC-1_WYH]